jgi:carbonic anhydrase
MRNAFFTSVFVTPSLLGAGQFARSADPAHPDQPIVAPAEAISRLKEGNGRFTAGNPQHPHESVDERKYIAANSYENAGMISLGMTSEQAAKRRAELAKSQHPFAIILSCSDSRVPPEIVFDEGLGDLFIVRVAGNVLNDEGLGSIEYAVDILGARLIVVLGHQSCGAVDAAMKTVAAKGKAPGDIQSLVAAIKPVVDSTPKGDLDTTIKANVKHVVDALRSSTPILKARVDSGDVQVIGGYYTWILAPLPFSSGSKSFAQRNRLDLGNSKGHLGFSCACSYLIVAIHSQQRRTKPWPNLSRRA